jgi:methionyl-tRNA formyltransferase
MRIVVNGQQAFGKAVLDALIERGEDVVAVYCAPEQEGQRADPLKAAALEHGLPIYQPASFKTPEVREEFATLNADLAVMAFVTLLVPVTILNLPAMGTIQYHPSLLPRHRGPSSINWPIIQGAAKTGLTIFWPDEGLDTRPVLLQKEIEITDDATLGSLYFNQLFPIGVAAMVEAVDLVRDGAAPRIAQDEQQATYQSWCRAADVEIDWTRPRQEVWNLIRGANPQPGAWTRHDGKTLALYDAVKRPAAGAHRPGEVVAVGADGITVAADGGAIQIQRVRPEGGKKTDAAEFVAASGLTAGDILG